MNLTLHRRNAVRLLRDVGLLGGLLQLDSNRFGRFGTARKRALESPGRARK